MASDFIAGQEPEPLPPELRREVPMMGTKNGNPHHLIIVDKNILPFYKIMDEKPFQFGDPAGEPVAIVVSKANHEPLGIALGRLNKDKTEITIGGIKYNDSTETRYDSPVENLPNHKHIVVGLNANKKFSQDDIDKIDQLVIDAVEKHNLEKAQKSSLGIYAPKLKVSDASDAAQKIIAVGRPSKSMQI